MKNLALLSLAILFSILFLSCEKEGLPRSINYIGGVNQSQRYAYSPGGVTIIFQNEDYSQFTQSTPLKFKIVTIAAE